MQILLMMEIGQDHLHKILPYVMQDFDHQQHHSAHIICCSYISSAIATNAFTSPRLGRAIKALGGPWY